MLICPICKEKCYTFRQYQGKKMCNKCAHQFEADEITDKAIKANSCSYFKDWNSKELTTAFFEVFGRYIKNPNKEDMLTIKYIWLWACHADKGVLESIHYAFKWAKMELYTERKRWGI